MCLYFGVLAKKATIATYVYILWRLSKVVDSCHRCVYISGAWQQMATIATYVSIFWRLSKVWAVATNVSIFRGLGKKNDYCNLFVYILAAKQI
jgi:hypothetical protein